MLKQRVPSPVCESTQIIDIEDSEEEHKGEAPITKESRHLLLESLNEKQVEAAVYKKSPLLILAGVGTGKTETLMRKFAYLIAKGTN